MKKLALLLALMLIPCTAFGLEMLNDNSLDEVTGQSGVSIAFDDIQLFLHVGRFAYLDCDGYGTNSNYGGTCKSDVGGGFVIENFEMDVININMINFGGAAAAFYEGTSVDQTVRDDAAIELDNTALSSDHIFNGRAYALTFDPYPHDGTPDFYYRNPGNQSTNADNGNYVAGYFNGNTVWTKYEGSLPLASNKCGSIPLFYDYGRTDMDTSCYLVGARWDTDDVNPTNNNFGLNNYTNTNNASTIAQFHPQVITIDVSGALPLHTGMLDALDPGSSYTIGGVLIGLPTLEIYMQQMHIGDITFTADLSSNTVTERNNVKNNNQSYGTILIEDVTFTTLGGWMEIAPTFTENANDPRVSRP